MPIISDTQVDPKELFGLRDPLVGQDIDARKPLVRCVNCDTVYFQSSYESLVVSTRGQCLNCKGDKFETLIPRVGASRGNRWDKGKQRSPGASNKSNSAPNFRVPLAYRGPILPAPSTGERWLDVLDDKHRRKIAELNYGHSGGELDTRTLAWFGDDALILGQSQRVFSVVLQSGEPQMIFSCPEWRGRGLYDLDCSKDAGIVAVAGNTFLERAEPARYHRWRATADTEYACHPEWNRVAFAPKTRGKCVRTGRTTYDNNSGWILGFRGFGVLTRYKGDEFFLYDSIDERPTRSFLLNGGPMILSDRHVLYWSPMERYLAIGSSLRRGDDEVGTIDLLDTRDEVDFVRGAVDGDKRLGAFAWHPAQDIYVSAYCHGRNGAPHGFVVVDAETNRVLVDHEIERNSITTSIDWSPTGRFVALGGYDQAVMLWDFENGEAHTLLGHREDVSAVHFSPDGQRLATASDDGKTIVWGCTPPYCKLAEFGGHMPHDYRRRLKGSPWSPSGRRLLTFSDGGIRVMQIG